MSASDESPPAQTPETVKTRPGAQVDLSQPILRQVAALGAGYDAWVHAPISARHGEQSPVPRKHSGSLRIFVRDFWERHSHIPWWLVLVVWVPIASGLFGLWTLAVGLPLAIPAMGGLLIGYLLYDKTHSYTPHGKPRGRWGNFLKRYHLEHPHRHWELMFGVSQPFWDIVFRTGRPRIGA